MNWLSINDKIFEEIACTYAKDTYNKYTWIPTGKSWDGNKDAEFREKLNSLNIYYKGWCEAKYTQNPEYSIPKSHMDSTLVSGILDGEVLFILFVTNGKITSDFIQRATAILNPHKIKLQFVDGITLTTWLNTRKDLITKYFANQTIDIPINTLEIEVRDSCFLDAVLSSPTLVTPLLKLKVNKEYYLYVNIYSSQQIEISVELDTNALKKSKSTSGVYSLSAGYNSFLIRYLAKYPYEGKPKILIYVDDEIKNNTEMQSIMIEEDDSIPIIYSAQQIALHELFDCVSNDFSNNAILHVYGSGGSGKSYLLQQLISDISKEHNQVLTIEFSEKETENASNLCKIILFVNFGYLYDLSLESYKQLIQGYNSIPYELLLELREGTQDQITAMNVVDKINNMFNEQPFALFPNPNNIMRRNKTFIIADDVQKVSGKQASLLKSIIEDFADRSYAQILIVSNRPNEFYDLSLENKIIETRIRNWSLLGITVKDVKYSIKNNLNDDISTLANLFPAPISVLHLELLIKKLIAKNIIKSPKEKRGAVFAKAYDETNIASQQLAVSKIKSCTYLNILYIVYKVESGVPVQFLKSYYQKEYESARKCFSNDTLIKEENAYLKPYHDIYLYAFLQMEFDESYREELNRFLSFCIEGKIDSPGLFSSFLSILIGKDNPLRDDYLPLAREICDNYYSRSEYIAAKNLAMMILPDIETTPNAMYDYNDIKLLYIYAQSEKYAKSHICSSKYLQKIADIGNVIYLSQEEKGYVHEAHSELITNHLFSLEIDKYLDEQEYFKKRLEGKVTLQSSEHTINAYLNYLNRQMLYAYFSDSSNLYGAYEHSLSECTRLNRDDYLAYTKMDYAKILVNTDMQNGLDLLQESLPVFTKYSKCKKREVDCKGEIVFQAHILHHSNYDELYKLQREAFNKNFIHIYANITLKILTLELMDDENPNNVEIKLTKLLIDYPDLNQKHRYGIFTNQILSAIYFKKGNLLQQKKYAAKQQYLAEMFSDKYTEIARHNQNLLNTSEIVWKHDNIEASPSAFWMDPRIW